MSNMNSQEENVRYLTEPIYVLAGEPCPNVTAAEFRAQYTSIQSERELAEAFAIADNQSSWVEDNIYDYDEETPEYKVACDVTDAWFAVRKEYEEKIFCILRNEGVTIPDKGTVTVLIPFMERNGYANCTGWWVKADLI